MLLYLINPVNPLISINKTKESRWNKYRIWKPLSLLVLAGLTLPEWEIRVIDENLGVPDYTKMPRPDLVGITSFTSQAGRAYELADEFKNSGITVMMGGIHATMCTDEALEYVDSVVKGEAESVWKQVLEDFSNGALKQVYTGEHLDLDKTAIARHDLLSEGYQFGLVQTSRGCPLNCSFCSVTAFNGRRYRLRPIEDVIEEMKMIKEKYLLIVDDNFIGTKQEHVERAKELCRAMIKAKIRKKWSTQVTTNMADDEEFLKLASKSGCFGVFIGFESNSEEGLLEINKKFNIKRFQNIKESVRRIRKHGIMVVGSYIMGLDVDNHGIGEQIANTANYCNMDFLNVLFLTSLPGTRLWDEMKKEARIIANDYPGEWKYYTLTCPVVRYNHLSWEEIIRENEICSRIFYSYRHMARRIIKNILTFNNPFGTIVGNLSYRNNAVRLYHEKYKDIDLSKGESLEGLNRQKVTESA